MHFCCIVRFPHNTSPDLPTVYVDAFPIENYEIWCCASTTDSHQVATHFKKVNVTEIMAI